jgi:DNA-binding MarR family transcriptional regulator/predicted GNAT family N-acyltransferase
MKNLNDFNELALGSRLKSLSDRMFADVDALYKSRGIELSSRCFASLLLLRANGSMGITELARQLGQTHSAVSQLSKTMLKAGVIDQAKDPSDERRRLLRITPAGTQLLEHNKDLMDDIEAALRDAIAVTQHEFMAALNGLDQQLDEMSLFDRVKTRENARREKAVEIIDFEPRYRDDFKRLNVEWLEKYFYVEAFDNQVLSNPEEYILEPGGHIFFARLDDEIIGTSSLIRQEDGRFELSKMSITEKHQGLGLGRKLAQRAIEQFKRSDSPQLFLETNTRLTPAIRLYESLGFVHAKPEVESHYQRADVYMIDEGD